MIEEECKSWMQKPAELEAKIITDGMKGLGRGRGWQWGGIPSGEFEEQEFQRNSFKKKKFPERREISGLEVAEREKYKA